MTPVHDQSYRHYTGRREPPGRAWMTILWTGVRGMISRKPFIVLLIAAWLPFLVRSVQIYAVTAYPQARQILPIDARMFQSFIEFQGLFAFFITIYAGSGLIAADRRANALQVYLSKPLMRTEYIAGKLGVLVVYLSGVTLLPGLLLILMAVVLSGSFDFIRQNAFVLPAVILASSLRVIVESCAMLALSAMSKSVRYVAVMYTGVVFFTEAMYGVLAFVTGTTRVAWISITGNFDVVTDWIFRQTPRYETPVAVSALVLLGIVVVSISVLERQVRGVEIVS